MVIFITNEIVFWYFYRILLFYSNIPSLPTCIDCLQQIFVGPDETDLIIMMISLSSLDMPLSIQWYKETVVVVKTRMRFKQQVVMTDRVKHSHWSRSSRYCALIGWIIVILRQPSKIPTIIDSFCLYTSLRPGMPHSGCDWVSPVCQTESQSSFSRSYWAGHSSQLGRVGYFFWRDFLHLCWHFGGHFSIIRTT